MKLIIAGIGFADMITLRALRAAESADMILVPRTKEAEEGYSERMMRGLLPDKKYRHIVFPMIYDPLKRQAEILRQLDAMSSDLEKADTIYFPVIGDAMLYSTGEYLQEALTAMYDVEVEFIAGVSAHSLAASIAKRYLVMRNEILAIIPGTAPLSNILMALDGCDCAAIYKPSALLEIKEVANDFHVENFGHVLRVDYAGIPELERVIEGDEALEDIDEYMSIVLLWRD